MNAVVKVKTHRGACDKCHYLKVRCEKRSTESGKCHRCTRLRLSCNYSPPLPFGRPRANTKTNPAHRRRSCASKSLSNGNHVALSPPLKQDLVKAELISSSNDQEYAMSLLLATPSEGVQWPEPEPSLPDAEESNTSSNFFHLQTPPISEHDFGSLDAASNRNGCWWPSLLEHVDHSQILSTPASGSSSTSAKSSTNNYGSLGQSASKPPTNFPLEDSKQIGHLLDLQLKLVKSHQSLVNSTLQIDKDDNSLYVSTMSNTIEEVYSMTQQFVDFARLCYEYAEVAFRGSPTSPAGRHIDQEDLDRGSLPHVSTILLLLSCYSRLIQVYLALIQVLHERCNQSNMALSATTLPPVSENSQMPYIDDGSALHMPAFRMTHSSLPMPPSANLGMHLVVIHHKIKLLKETMSACITQNVGFNKTSAACSARLIGPSNGYSPALTIVDLVMPELAFQEEQLMTVFHSAKSDAEP